MPHRTARIANHPLPEEEVREPRQRPPIKIEEPEDTATAQVINESSRSAGAPQEHTAGRHQDRNARQPSPETRAERARDTADAQDAPSQDSADRDEEIEVPRPKAKRTTAEGQSA